MGVGTPRPVGVQGHEPVFRNTFRVGAQSVREPVPLRGLVGQRVGSRANPGAVWWGAHTHGCTKGEAVPGDPIKPAGWEARFLVAAHFQRGRQPPRRVPEQDKDRL